MKSKKPEQPAPVPAPKTERELRAAKIPRFDGDLLEITTEQMDEACNLLKTDHEAAAIRILASSIQGTSTGDDSSMIFSLNASLQQFSDLKPENYLESMLIAQMIQVSNAAGKCMERAFLDGQTFGAKEMNANLAIKFQRTFVAQIEALQKLRGKGGQKVTVEHVHVHEGGQAIVGNVSHAPGGEE